MEAAATGVIPWSEAAAELCCSFEEIACEDLLKVGCEADFEEMAMDEEEGARGPSLD